MFLDDRKDKEVKKKIVVVVVVIVAAAVVAVSIAYLICVRGV
jgi:hypothetical protein